MPRNRFGKGSRRNQEENLYSEVDEAQIRPRTIPASKLETVQFDYRNQLSEADYNRAVRRCLTPNGNLDRQCLFRDLERTNSERRRQEVIKDQEAAREREAARNREGAGSDSSQSTFKYPLPPRMRKLSTRRYARLGPPQVYQRSPSPPTLPTRTSSRLSTPQTLPRSSSPHTRSRLIAPQSLPTRN
jgi:hypothetical protein